MKQKSFWCNNPQETADYVIKNFKDEAAQTERLANDICENTFTFREHWEMERTNIPVTFKGEIDWEHMPAQDREWTYAFNRHTCFVILAKAWLYKGEKKYADAFTKIARSWIENAILSEKTKNGSWRSLEAGLRCETWLRAIQIFKECPDIPPELFDELDASLRVHAEYLKHESADFHVLSNWGVLQDHGLFLLGLHFNDSQLCELAVNRLTDNLEIQFFRDGTHWEQSPMYHCEVLHCFLDVLVAGRACSYVFEADFEQKIQKACQGLALWVKPNGYLPMQSDSDNIDARDLLCCGAYLFNDGMLKAYAHEKHFEENVWDFGVAFIAEYDKIIPQFPAMPSVALPDSGNYALRSSNSTDAVWLHFHCGCLGSGHGHADQLHIDLSAYGEDILIDTGRYSYVNSPERRATKGARGHNTVTVDGAEFSEQLDTWGYNTLANPVKGEYTFTEAAGFVSGAHLGYFKKGVYTRRRVIQILPDIYIIADTFYANGAHSYEQLFHFGKGNVSVNGTRAEFKGKKASACFEILGNELTLSLEKHFCSYEYNLADECTALSVKAKKEGTFNFITAVSVCGNGHENNFEAVLLPVTARRKGIILPFEKACGIKLCKNGKEYTVLLTHEELISEVELLEANGHCGYGKAVIFGEEFPKTGLCLEW